MRLRVLNQHSPPLTPYEVYREGVVLDVGCPWATIILHQSSESRSFNYRYTWLMLHNSSFDPTATEKLLVNISILPDADVTWLADDTLVNLYKVKEHQPLTATKLIANMSATEQELELLWGFLPTVITQPQHFKSWTDLTTRHIEPFPKVTYPIMILCAEDLNFRYNLQQVDLYGSEHNGAFDGAAGLLQRGEVEMGFSSLFMRADRFNVLHFVAETLELRASFIFRQPPQSSGNNVFLLPFSRGVWACSAAVFLMVAGSLAALSFRLIRADPTLAQLTPAEVCTFTVGTICQQGSYLNPSTVSVRIVMLFTLFAAFFIFTSYSAKIVAILQTPSDAIQTIDDLARSPFTLGVENTTYKHIYFSESNDPATQRLYRHKLLPLGDRAYLSVVDGVNRLRTDMFAFQAEETSAHDIISKTFTEREKCGLKHIQAFKLPMVSVPVRRLSGYRELLAARLRWQREVGLMDRWRRVWLVERARCLASNDSGFVNVRLADVWPAVQVLMSGMILATLLLIAELTLSRAEHKVK
ncbi:unnamed protein product [Diatraea saccharalis]|uniref:Uncharacterized protein n=1 Tax=Diatraea saccharalis TaxID=40085 RepID=A0A9N9QXL4_9NEOP|nr:unnamed protein product [Diatraea saccharalis]